MNFSLPISKFPLVAPQPLFKKALAVTLHELGHRCSPAACSQCQSPVRLACSWLAVHTTKIEDQVCTRSDGYNRDGYQTQVLKNGVLNSSDECFSNRHFYRLIEVEFVSPDPCLFKAPFVDFAFCLFVRVCVCV